MDRKYSGDMCECGDGFCAGCDESHDDHEINECQECYENALDRAELAADLVMDRAMNL